MCMYLSNDLYKCAVIKLRSDLAFQYMYYKMIITRSEVFENSEDGLF